MKQELVTQNAKFSDPETEAIIQKTKDELTTTCELQGVQDAKTNKPKTTAEHQALILNLIQVKIQTILDYLKKKFLPISGLAAAKLIQAEAEKKITELTSAIHDTEHKLIEVKKEAESLMRNPKLIETTKWVLIGLGFIAITEGFLSYSPFRYAHFPVIASIIASIAVAVAVYLGAHYSGGYIKAAKNKVQTIIRYFICMVPTVIFFSVLAGLRAGMYNHNSNVQVGSDHVSSHSTGSTSAIGIALISIILYFLGLFLSAKFYRTDEEAKKDHRYVELMEEAQLLEGGIKEKEDQIVIINYEKVAKMDQAMNVYEFAMHLEKQLVNYADEIAEHYKQKNMRFRTDGIPAFFSHKPVFNFQVFFSGNKNNSSNNNNFNHQNQQQYEIH